MSKLNTKTIVIIGVVVVILIAVVAEILVSTAEERHRRKNPNTTPGKPHCKAMSISALAYDKEQCAFFANEADCKSSKDLKNNRICQWVTG